MPALLGDRAYPTAILLINYSIIWLKMTTIASLWLLVSGDAKLPAEYLSPT